MEIKSKVGLFIAFFGLLCGADRAVAGVHSDLHEAARRGNVATVQRLVDVGVSVDAVEDDMARWTALHWAAYFGCTKIAQLLIDAGAGVNLANSRGETALHNATREGHEEIAQLLINAGAHIDSKDDSERTPLLIAVSEGDEATAQLLIDAGAGVNLANSRGETALHEAAYCGHVNIARLLLEIGADVNAVDNGEWTPLHNAAANGHEKVAQLLIQFGAEVNATNKKSTADDESTDDESVDDESTDYDEYRNTPLNEAARNDHWNLVQLLLQANANPNAKDDDGEAPLHHAVAYGQESVIKLLIDYGADVDVVANRSGDTPLFKAITTKRAKLVRLLINLGANVNKQIYDPSDGFKCTPLLVAASSEDVEIAQLLIDAGADVHARDEMGQAVLHYAAGLVSEAQPATTRLLIDSGADVNVVDDNGSTPLYVVVNSFSSSVRRARVAKILVERGADIRKAYGYYEEAPLICAIKRGNEWFARLLVKQGEDIKAKDRQGQIALGLCSERLRRELQEISDARQKIVQQMKGRIRPGAQAHDSRPRKKQRHS